MFGVFTVNEFQDESNESLEPQDDSTPVADDNVSQDSVPEEVGKQAEAEEVPQAEDIQPEVADETTQEDETSSVAPGTEAADSDIDEQVSEQGDIQPEEDSGQDDPAEQVATENVVEEVASEQLAADEEAEVTGEEVVEETEVEVEVEVETENETAEEVAESEPESEPEVGNDPEDVPFDPHNIPKKYDSQTFEWYILKVQVNRETSIRDGLLRRIKMEGLEEYFEEVIVPTEDIVEFTRSGKRKVVKRKLYPGYIMVKMMLQDDSWFLVRETPGIGDFTGTFGKPTPMPAEEVERILSVAQPEEDAKGEEPQLKTAIPFKAGDRVRVKDGNFQNFEGEVDGIDEANGRVTLIINIFGRSTPVELEHWQIEEL